jgi:hypothetical protein
MSIEKELLSVKEIPKMGLLSPAHGTHWKKASNDPLHGWALLGADLLIL